MGFHKLILDFANLAMRLVKNILGHFLKIKSFITGFTMQIARNYI